MDDLSFNAAPILFPSQNLNSYDYFFASAK